MCECVQEVVHVPEIATVVFWLLMAVIELALTVVTVVFVVCIIRDVMGW